MCGLLIATTLVVGIAVIYQQYQTALANSQREINNLGIVLAEQTSRTIQSVDLVLREVLARTSSLGIHAPEQFRSKLTGETIRQFLSGQLRNLPQVETIVLIDSNGTLLNWSRDEVVPEVDLSDREYFRQMSASDDSDAFFSAPGEGRITGKWLMFMARRVSDADGTFLGIVVALINVDYLEDFYKTISMLPGESVTMLRRDGVAITGYPDIADRRGRQMPGDSPWHDIVTRGSGSYISPGYFGGKPGIVTVHPLHDYPLVVDVNMSEHAALRYWRNQSVGIIAAMIGVATGLTILFGVITVQFRRQQEQNEELSQAAEALRESERGLKAYAEMSADWFWEQDSDYRFTRHSDVSLTSVQTDAGRTAWDIADGGMNPDRWVAHKADLAARRPFRDFHWERIRSGGERRFISTSGDPIVDDAGIFLGYHGTGRDITKEVVARSRAEQAEMFLRDAVDSMSAAFVIYDRDERFVMCNEPYLQSYSAMYAGSADLLRPGARLEDILRQVLVNGGDVRSQGREEQWVTERLRYHRDATGSIEQRLENGSWFLITNRRMKNGGVTGLRIDITALKQAQAALGESEAMLDRAQEIAGIGSWELDTSTRRFVWSKELYRIRGLAAADFVPTIDNNIPYVHAEDHAPMSSWLAMLIDGHEESACEMRAVRPDGGVRLLRVEGRAITDPDGVVRRVAGTMQDVTDLRLIERQLAQSQKMEAIGNLTGGMAHDFNNGLAVIIGNLDLLAQLIKADPSATELCGEARDGASRCADLIRLLLAFARRQPLDPHQIDVNALVESTMKLLSRTLGEDITLLPHLDPGLPPVVVDPVQLEAALTNLANNARDAMPRGGSLAITTRIAKLDARYAALHPDADSIDYVLIEIGDTGTGIDAEVIGSIFEHILYHQRTRARHRTWLVDGFRFRRSVRWPRGCRKRAGARHDISYLPAARAARRCYKPGSRRFGIHRGWRRDSAGRGGQRASTPCRRSAVDETGLSGARGRAFARRHDDPGQWGPGGPAVHRPGDAWTYRWPRSRDPRGETAARTESTSHVWFSRCPRWRPASSRLAIPAAE